MFKIFIPILAAAVCATSVPILSGCVPTHLYDVPGYTCPVYDQYFQRFVPGPFVPYTPYVPFARGIEQQQYALASNQQEYFHNWQSEQLDNQKAFFDNSPWPKPWGYDSHYNLQKEWLNAHQNIQTQNLNQAHENREAFLNAQESG